MNILKKIQVISMATASICTSILGVTSCSLDFVSSQTMVVGSTDWRDGSFLEDIFMGALNGDKTAGWIITQDNSTATFEKAFRTLIAYGAKTIVAAGAGEKTAVMNSDGKFEDVKFILVDEFADWNNVTEQVTAINYQVQQAAFVTGYQVGLYVTTIHSELKLRDEIRFSGWGGADYTAVGNFLVGFRQGLEYFNFKFPNFPKLKWVLRDENNRQNNFSGGWSPGANNALDNNIATDLIIGKKVDVILPVAASQAQTALKISRDRNNSKTLVIGVDSDMRNVYSSYQDLILTSIIKNSRVAISDAVIAANKKDQTNWKENFGSKTYHATVENKGVWYVDIEGLNKVEDDVLQWAENTKTQSQDCDWAQSKNWCQLDWN